MAAARAEQRGRPRRPQFTSKEALVSKVPGVVEWVDGYSVVVAE